MIVIVMGVSGCGKTTVGRWLAWAWGVPFHDADDFHPPANIEKMTAGRPLEDADRWPWLDALAAAMPRWEAEGGAVLACSALKAAYRARLRPPGVPVRFVYLAGTPALIARRMRERADHFMPEALLASQFATLEPPADALVVSIDQPPEAIVAEILAAFREAMK